LPIVSGNEILIDVARIRSSCDGEQGGFVSLW